LKDYQDEMINFLLNRGMLKFGDFEYKGLDEDGNRRRGPYFINITPTTGGDVMYLTSLYKRMLEESGVLSKRTVLFGPAYKGIRLATSLAEHLDLPFLHDRAEVKDHGEGGDLSGHKLQKGDEVIIVEDITNQGTSIDQSIAKIESQTEAKVIAVTVAVDRMEINALEGVRASFLMQKKYGIQYYPVITIGDIYNTLLGCGDSKIASAQDIKRLELYLEDKAPEALL
jgi:orotate phosphoribosyltransferase